METKTVNVANIGCDGCVNTIKNEIGALPGVNSVEGSPQTQTITIQWEQPADWPAIRRVLAAIDYAPDEA
jgi:copper chaperone CopZ